MSASPLPAASYYPDSSTSDPNLFYAHYDIQQWKLSRTNVLGFTDGVLLSGADHMLDVLLSVCNGALPFFTPKNRVLEQLSNGSNMTQGVRGRTRAGP